MREEKTIAAISTPAGHGGIAMIRLSGRQAVLIADKIFNAASGKKLEECETNTLHFGTVRDEGGTLIDEVVTLLYKAPHSYTGEDTVEICCHGGVLVSRAVLQRALSAGAVLAQNGEFSKRAFLNGRMDLNKAEAVIDLITAKGDLEQINAAGKFDGRMSAVIEQSRNAILSICSHIGAYVDFPDEDIDELEGAKIKQEISAVQDRVNRYIGTCAAGEIIKEGIRCAIIGKPNVGKSSLMNLLSGFEKSIVTEIAGTTRDILEEQVIVSGAVLRIFDTAGIRDGDDEVERIGIERAIKNAGGADLIIAVFDATGKLDSDDEKILELCKGKKAIAIINKRDLSDAEISLPDIFYKTIDFSCVTGQGHDELEKSVEELFNLGEIRAYSGEIITNARQKDALFRAGEALERALLSCEHGTMWDMLTIDLEEAAQALGEISGKTINEEIVDTIFSRFCLGK